MAILQYTLVPDENCNAPGYTVYRPGWKPSDNVETSHKIHTYFVRLSPWVHPETDNCGDWTVICTDGKVHSTHDSFQSATSTADALNRWAFIDQNRIEFEIWLQEEQQLQATWNDSRNCYDEFPAHLAFNAWCAARKPKN